jgi:DNA-binding MarR family transcriptional regulator
MAEVNGSAPRWLTAEERSLWLALNGVLTRLPQALDAQLERDGGLSYFEYLFMAMLSEREDRTLQMSELAACTNASLSRLSHVARRLEARGYLRREADVADRRCTNAMLTNEGFAAVATLAPLHVAEVRRLVFDAIAPEAVRPVTTVLQGIMDIVDPSGHVEPGR